MYLLQASRLEISSQDRPCTWRERLTIAAVETNRCVLCVLLSYICHCQQYKILTVAQQCFHVASNNKTYLGFHAKCPILLPDFNQVWIFQQILIEVPSINVRGNLSRESRLNVCGQTDGRKSLRNKRFSQQCECA